MVGEKGKLESVASGIEADAGGRMEVWSPVLEKRSSASANKLIFRAC